ncbi:MAG: phosphonate C-P lyase system protein PhnH [Thermodesulfobacteriota bacterium]
MMEAMTAWNLLPGFPNPALDSQRTFRQVLKAMAHPGRLVSLEIEMEVPQPLYRTTAAICLTLLDGETPLWMDLDKRSEAADWLRFHCGCPLVDSPILASFGLISGGYGEPSLDRFRLGEDEFPEQSTTLIIQVAGFTLGSGRCLRGPGVKNMERLEVHGLPEPFWKIWNKNQRLYPRGVDVFFASASTLVGLPRTTEVMK